MTITLIFFTLFFATALFAFIVRFIIKQYRQQYRQLFTQMLVFFQIILSVTIISCDFSFLFPAIATDSTSIQLRLSSTVEDVSITSENSGKNITVQFLEGVEVVLSAGWSEETEIESALYTLTPQNEHISINQTDGTITIATSARVEDSGNYSLVVSQINGGFESIEVSLRIIIDKVVVEKVIDGRFVYSTEHTNVTITFPEESSENTEALDSVVNIPQGEEVILTPTWTEQSDEQQQVAYSLSPTSQHITIDATEGTLTLLASIESTSLGDYVVRATGVTPYKGEVSHAIRFTSESSIDGKLSYTSLSDKVLINTQEEGQEKPFSTDSEVLLEQGNEVVLNAEWTNRTDENQKVSYTLNPENTDISIDATSGDITIVSGATYDDSHDYTVTVTGIEKYRGEITHSIDMNIGILLSTYILSYSDIEVIEGIPIESSKGTWSQSEPTGVTYTIASDATSDVVDIDSTTGEIRVGDQASQETLASDGTYTVTVTGGQEYIGSVEAVLMIALVDACDALTSGIAPKKADGSDTYAITNWKELLYLSIEAKDATESPRLSDSYALDRSITLPHKACKAKRPEATIAFDPIGTNSKHFTGYFDGQGNSITGLYFDDATRNHVGLFGVLKASSKATVIVEDLMLSDFSINANAVAGGLAGGLFRGTVQNVRSDNGSVSTDAGYTESVLGGSISYGYTGGLIGGSGEDTVVTHSSSSATVNGQNQGTGGLIGYVGGEVLGFATGAVTGGANYTGGIAGYSKGTIKGYATGTIEAQNYVGGLVGYTKGTTRGYSTSSITGSSYVGGLAGLTSTGTTLYGYFSGSVTGFRYTGGVVGYASGTIHGYAVGTVTADMNTGGMIGQLNSNSSALGYSRSNVESEYRRTLYDTFGKLVATNNGTMDGYYSSKASESTLYQLSSTDVRGEYGENRDSTVLGSSVSVSSSDSTTTLKTRFSLLDFEGDDAKWEVTNGHWPAIKLPELDTLEGAVNTASEQSIYTVP